MSSTPPAQVVQDDHSAADTNHPPANTSDQILNNQLLAEYQGDCIDEKRNNTFRIGLININGLPKSSKHPKNKNIKEFLTLSLLSKPIASGLQLKKMTHGRIDSKNGISKRVKVYPHI